MGKVPELVGAMDVSADFCHMLWINVHDVFLKLCSHFSEKAFVVGAVCVEWLKDVDAEVGAHAWVVKGTCLKIRAQDDHCEGQGVDG